MPEKTILLIQDHPEVHRNTSDILEQGGYAVVKAEYDERAVELARQDPPDLVLCDIVLPLMNGYRLLQELARDPKTAAIPFIFLGDKTEGVVNREKRALGADDQLTKPFEENELLVAVEERLKHSLLFRRSFAEDVDGMNEFLDLARGAGVLKELSQNRKTRLLKEQEIIFREGDLLQDIPFVVQGKVRAFRVNKDDKELTTALYGTGDFIGYQGLLQDGLATESAEALEASKVALIPQEELLELLHGDHDVSMCFVKMLARDSDEKREHLLQMAYASIRQRVAQSLLRIQERYAKADDQCIGVLISREDLASVVGTATESLIRCLSDLKAENLITVDGREICIVDESGLQKLAHR